MKFDIGNATVQEAGRRVSNDVSVELNTSPTKNNFRLSHKAAEKMGLKEGDRIIFFLDYENRDERGMPQFAFGKYNPLNVEKEYMPATSKLQSNGSDVGNLAFSYSGVWQDLSRTTKDGTYMKAFFEPKEQIDNDLIAQQLRAVKEGYEEVEFDETTAIFEMEYLREEAYTPKVRKAKGDNQDLEEVDEDSFEADSDDN